MSNAEFKVKHIATKLVLEGALVDMQGIADSLPPPELTQVTEELEDIAQSLARRAGYFHNRQLGCDHRESVNRSNRTVAALRKSLRYTQSKFDLNF